MTDIERIVLTAINLAKKFKHEYVTIEHLAAVILDDDHIRSMCFEVSADCEGLQVALVDYLENECGELVVDSTEEPNPRKTQMLERVFNRALTQALFQNKKAINQFDLIISILSEDRSTSAVYAEQMGLSKYKVLHWVQGSDDITMSGEFRQDYRTTETSADAAEYYNEYSKSRQTQLQQPQMYVDVLKQFCNNLCEQSYDFDDVVGRREELKDLVQTIARKKKSNAILVGPSGVGKTAIVQGLAKLVAEGSVPDIIADTTVWELDMGKLVAGTKYRGDFDGFQVRTSQ